jgi:hypothetical protein
LFGTKKSTPSDAPSLLERTFAEGCTRLAVIGLHPGAGARTILDCIAMEFHRRGVSVGVTRAPRIPLDARLAPDAVPPMTLPEGTIVATTAQPEGASADLEPLGPVVCSTALGDLGVFRVKRECQIPIYGPDDPGTMAEVMARLDDESEGLALVDGAWERRGFAAPSVAQGVILVVGSGYSGNPERSAAAVRYTAEILGVPSASADCLRAWPGVVASGNVTILHADGGQSRISLAPGEDLVSRIAAFGDDAAAAVFPDLLDDHVLGPLSRSSIRCTLVVRDPTCIRAAPIYYRAWTKQKREVHVIEPMRVVAVATNPSNPRGPDANPKRFRELVEEALPELPTHDVVLEAAGARRKRMWGLASLLGKAR